jgi:glycosyltransferase involved in cell wall biosynthesis
MRILQIFNQYRFHGGEEAWVESVEHLATKGGARVSELRFLSSDWTDEGAPSKVSQARLMGHNPEAGKRLEETIRVERPDVCLFHNVIPVASLGIYGHARKMKVPVIQYIHNFRPFSPSGTLWVGESVNPAALAGNMWPEILHGGWQGSRLKTLILAWHLKRAIRSGLLNQIDHWISPSQFMKDHFVKAGVSEDRITVIPHCHHGKIRETPAEEGDYYLFLGRLDENKGILILLKAWDELASKFEGKIPKLYIAGSGSLETHVKTCSESNPNVQHLGHVGGEQKQALLDQCRAVIIPSICWESLGLTAYEAYASRRPVIASRAGALQETVQDGVTGWHFQPGNAQDLATTIQQAEQAGSRVREARGMAGGDWLTCNALPEQWREKFLNTCTQTIVATESRGKSSKQP